MPGAAARRPSGCGRRRARVQVRETRTLRPIIGWRLGRYAPAADSAVCATCSPRTRSRCSPRTAWSASPGSPGSCGRSATRSSRFDGAGGVPRLGRSRGSARSRCGTRCCRTAAARRSARRCGSGAPSRRAQLRFRPYWAFIGPFSRFIGSELLSAATRRAERTSAGDVLSAAAGDVDRERARQLAQPGELALGVAARAPLHAPRRRRAAAPRSRAPGAPRATRRPRRRAAPRPPRRPRPSRRRARRSGA